MLVKDWHRGFRFKQARTGIKSNGVVWSKSADDPGQFMIILEDTNSEEIKYRKERMHMSMTQDETLALVLDLAISLVQNHVPANRLRWVLNLPEVGPQTRAMAGNVNGLDAQIIAHLDMACQLRRELQSAMFKAETEIGKQWAGNEIEEAKARANV